MFRQIKIRHVAEEVFDQIKSAIETGKLKPGEKLPAERELMGQLGVSRVPIREALKLLSNMGLIETRQGGGSYVRALLSDRLLDPLGAIIADSAEKLFEAGRGAQGNRDMVGMLRRERGEPGGNRRHRPRAPGNEDACRFRLQGAGQPRYRISPRHCPGQLQYDTGAPVPYHPGHIFRLFQAYHRDHLPARRATSAASTISTWRYSTPLKTATPSRPATP